MLISGRSCCKGAGRVLVIRNLVQIRGSRWQYNNVGSYCGPCERQTRKNESARWRSNSRAPQWGTRWDACSWAWYVVQQRASRALWRNNATRTLHFVFLVQGIGAVRRKCAQSLLKALCGTRGIRHAGRTSPRNGTPPFHQIVIDRYQLGGSPNRQEGWRRPYGHRLEPADQH